MKGFRLKILLVLFMLFHIPFSCKDKDECSDDFYVEPYYSILGMDFDGVDLYYKTKTGTPMFDSISQDYANQVYPGDSLAMSFSDTLLMYHSQQIKSTTLSFTQEAFACTPKRPGYAGTRDLVDKIYISSNYDFDETHNKNDNLSDIVDILPYTPGKKETWMLLDKYNRNSPYAAPKRFYLFLKRKPTISMTQQFVIRYYMKTELDGKSKYFVITTPVLHLR